MLALDRTILKEIAYGNPQVVVGHRVESSSTNGTNCTGEMVYFLKKGLPQKIFMKKSFLKGDLTCFIEEYAQLKSRLKNIVPNQAFIQCGENIFTFCSPIEIKIDALLPKNREYLLRLIMTKPRLKKQIIFFIKTFYSFAEEGKIIDLNGKENLVVSSDDRLYYVDSFLVFYKNLNSEKTSMSAIKFLESVINDANNQGEK